MDREEFTSFYAASFQRLVGQLYAMTGDQAEAQDAVQEAFVRAWARRSKIDRDQAPEAWVRVTAWRIAASRWRHAQVGVRLMVLNARRESTEGPDPGCDYHRPEHHQQQQLGQRDDDADQPRQPGSDQVGKAYVVGVGAGITIPRPGLTGSHSVVGPAGPGAGPMSGVCGRQAPPPVCLISAGPVRYAAAIGPGR